VTAMHAFQIEIARQDTARRIAAAERHRTVRDLTRARRAGNGGARRWLGPLVHGGAGLARPWSPE
jgi:hypothetical protein